MFMFLSSPIDWLIKKPLPSIEDYDTQMATLSFLGNLIWQTSEFVSRRLPVLSMVRFKTRSTSFSMGSRPSAFKTNSISRSNVSTIVTMNRTRFPLSARCPWLVFRQRKLGSSCPRCSTSTSIFGSCECFSSRREKCRTLLFDFEQRRKTSHSAARCSRRGEECKIWSTR